MTTSSQDAAEDALLALLVTAYAGLAADATLGAIGPPTLFRPAAWAKQAVWIDENTELTQAASLTAGDAAHVQRQEDFEIHVICAVEKLGDVYVATRDRGRALVAVVEDVVRNNAKLSDTVWYAEITGIERRSGASADGRQRWVGQDVTVACRSFLVGP